MPGPDDYDDYGADETVHRRIWGRAGPSNDAATASVVFGLIACVLFFVCAFPFLLGSIAVALGGLGFWRAQRSGVGRIASISGLTLGLVGIILGLLQQGWQWAVGR